ncbi:MAG: SIMPL domain-containing protein [Pseudomonadota bacterium]
MCIQISRRLFKQSLGPLILLAALAAPVAAEEVATMTFSGTGSVSVVPDEASISLGVITQGPTAEAALAANTPAIQGVIDLLKEAGIASEDLRTDRFDLSPIYGRQDGNRREITGYQVANTLRVRVADLADLGEILDQVVSAGATTIGGIQLSYGDREGALDEARTLALADARRKADLMAEAAGVTLGRILSIHEGGGSGPMPVARAMMVSEASVPIEAGSTAISARLTVVWQIE